MAYQKTTYVNKKGLFHECDLSPKGYESILIAILTTPPANSN